MLLSIPRLAPWPQLLPTGSSSSPASGSRRATGSRCARPTPASSSRGSRRAVPPRRSGRSTPPSRRCASRCPRTSERRSSSRSWPGSRRRHDEVARQISDEAGKPLKAARVETSRAMSTYTFAAVEARKLAGEMVPMDAAQAGEGKLGFTLRRADRDRRRDLAVQLPAQPGRTQAGAGARGGLRGRAQARVRRRRSRRCCWRSSRTRRVCRPAGSASSSARRPRSATCSSRTSA